MRFDKFGLPQFDFEPTVLKQIRNMAKMVKPFDFPTYAINRNLLGIPRFESGITEILKPLQLSAKMLGEVSSLQRVASYAQFLEQAVNMPKLSFANLHTLSKFKENYQHSNALFEQVAQIMPFQNNLASEIMRPVFDFQKIYNQNLTVGSIDLKSISRLHETLKSFQGMRLFAAFPHADALVANASQLIAETQKSYLYEATAPETKSLDSTKRYITAEQLTILLTIIFGILGILVDIWIDRGNDPSSDAMVDLLESGDAKQTEVLDSLRDIEGLLGEIKDRLELPDNNSRVEKHYVITREAPLRIAPNAEAIQISRIHINQSVLLIKKSKTWLYVSFYDYVENIPKIGWINQRNVKPITLEEVEDVYSFEERLNEPNLDFEEALKDLTDEK